MLKIKEMIIVIRVAGGLISRKILIPIEAGVLKVSNPSSLSELEGNFIMTDIWGKGVLKSIDWVKLKELRIKWNHQSRFQQKKN